MRLPRLDVFRTRWSYRRVHLVGHIADVPQVIGWQDKRYMVFHLRELPGTVFHVTMPRVTPGLHKGDRVELTCRLADDATAFVESLEARTDLEIVRRAGLRGSRIGA